MATMWLYLFVWGCFHCLFHVQGAGFDFTCFSTNPLLGDTGDDNAYIGGYKSGTDINAHVDFSRAVDTGTGNALPSGSSQRNHPSDGVFARLLDMPGGGVLDRIGVFNCEGTYKAAVQLVPTIINHINAVLIPDSVTITANIGDGVSLTVTGTATNLIWIKDGDTTTSLGNTLTLPITNVNHGHEGVYECYNTGDRSNQRHAIMRLIIRECDKDTWGPPSCLNDCQVCYNGGICDDVLGHCICAPGFSGINCELLHGRNHFGQDGKLKCSSSHPGTGCKGNLFCLPDPYGCSCAAGYKGKDCNTPCSNGTFGADCKQTCHCASGVSVCDIDTGWCSSGGCEDDWSGDNCQVNEILSLTVNPTVSSSTSLTVSWTSRGSATQFQVDYQLTNEDHCKNEVGTRISLSPTNAKQINIPGLKPYSAYKVYVTPISSVCGIMTSKMGSTSETKPTAVPENVRIESQTTTSLEYAWDAIPCGSRGGSIKYKWDLDSTPPQSGETANTVISLSGLQPCTDYKLKVKASNSAGDGSATSGTGSTDDDKPGAVTSLKVQTVQSNPDSLQVDWDPPMSPCAADTYTVHYQLTNLDQCDDTTGPKTKVRDLTGTTIVISGLHAHSTYGVFVASTNSHGSEEVTTSGTTAIKAPNAPPGSVRIESWSTTGLGYAWDAIPCGSRGGSITYKWSLNSAPPRSDTTTNTNIEVTGLVPCTDYEFKVKASNSAGDGGEGSISGSTNVEKPGAVSSLTVQSVQSNPDSLQVEWDPPTTPCTADKYTVYYQITNLDQCDTTPGAKTKVRDLTDTSVTITGLHAHSTYTVFVSSSNSVGSTEESKSATTAITAPTAKPGRVRIESSTKTSLQYAWDAIPCGFRGGIITYKWTLDTTPPRSDTTTNTAVMVDGLNSCSNYTFKVTASNTAGDGGEVSVPGSTEDDKPGAVTSLKVQTVQSNPDSLQVAWDPPITSCAADKYTVHYQLTNLDQCDNMPGTKTKFRELTDTSITITGLQAYSTYTVFVSSSNSVGSSELSKSATTAITAPSSPPQDIKVKSRTSTKLTFEWLKVLCGDRGGFNSYYFVVFDEMENEVYSGTTTELSVTINSLVPCAKYDYTIRAFNDAGNGNFSEPYEGTTDSEVLGPVKNLAIDDATSYTLSVSWGLQDTSNCPTDTHVIKYALNNRDQCQVIDDPVKIIHGNVHGTNVSIPQLYSHSTYEVFIYSSNDKGLGNENSVIDDTKESAPSGTPQYLEADVDKYAIGYLWDELICGERNGIIQHYAYTLTPSAVEDNTESREVLLENLDPCTEYTFSLAAVNSIDDGPQISLTNTTDNAVPNSPTSLDQQTSNREITVTWNVPEKVTCTIINYHVTRRTVNKPYDAGFVPPRIPEQSELLPATTMEYTFENLEPTTEYEITVSASTDSGMGESVSANFSTDPLETDELGEPVPKPSKLKSNATSVTIEIPQLTGLESEYMTGFKIIVDPQNQNTLTVTPNPGTSYEAGTVDKSAVENGPQEFIVDGLEKNVKYYIFVGTCSVIGKESNCVWSEHISHGGSTKPSPEAIYIPIILIAAVTVVVLVGFVYRRRQFSSKSASTADVIGLTVGKSNGSSNAVHSPLDGRSRKHHTAAANDAIVTGELPGPVKVTNLKEYVRRKKSGEDSSFADDYQRLPKGLLHSYDAAKDEHNQLKNRYTNIATYDNSRVLLSVQGNDPNSDYINASYIDGYNRPGMYIASQGPNKASMNDFWRMVWEHNLNKIVMVTNLVEGVKPKCDKYWPDKEMRYGSIMVSKKREDVFTDFTIRVFQISDMASPDSQVDIAGVQNESLGGGGDCYSDDSPSAGEVLKQLPNHPVTLTILILVTIGTCVLVGLFIETIYFVGRKLPRSAVPNHRMNIIWMVSIYPMFALISLPGLYIPNAAPFCNIIISLFYTLVLFKFFVILCDYFGGHRAMMETLKSEKIFFPLASAPLLACFRCLPQRRLTRRSFRWLKVFTLQVAFVRPLMMFILAIMWLDGVAPGEVENETVFLVINLVMIISTLAAMTVLTMLYRAASEELKGYNIGPKFWLVKLGLIIDNLQSALLNVLSSFRLLGCKLPFPLPVRSNQWQCLMLIIDSCILFPFVLKYYHTANGNVIGYSTMSTDAATNKSRDHDVIPMKYKPSEIQRMLSAPEAGSDADKLRSMTL